MDHDFLKKLTEQLDQSTPSDSTDPELSQLLKVAEKLSSSAFHPTPPSAAFQTRLKEKITEARNSQARKGTFDSLARSLGALFTLPAWRPVVAAIVLAAVVITSTQIWSLFSSHSNPASFSRLIIDTAYAQDNFVVEPTKADSIGVETNSGFTITSKQVIDKEVLAKNLKLVPGIPYKLQKISDHEFAVLPQEPLKPNTLHRVYISSSYINEKGITVERPYSWAFQVKDMFKVVSTLPADKTARIPINTGIEITFSHDNITNFEKNFSIEPAVKGKFAYKGRTLTFIPDQSLSPATIYTVKVGKEIMVEGSRELLDDEKIIQFETAATSTERSSEVGFAESMVEFDTRTAPAIPVFTTYYNPSSPQKEISAPTKLFRFNSAEEFMREFERKQTLPSWSYYHRSVYRTPTSSLTQVASFTGRIQELGPMRYLTFPQKLSAGYYVVESYFTGQPVQVFLQITDLATYITMSDTKTLLWVNNLQTGQPGGGTTVKSFKTNFSTTVNQDGVALFDTKQLFGTSTSTYNYLLIGSGPLSKVEEVLNSDFSQPADQYWSYLYTDRQLYHNNDTIEFWGMVQPRENTTTSTQEVVIELSRSGITYALQKLPLNKLHVFSNKIILSQALAGEYELLVKVNNEVIARNYLRVENYTKPAYQIEVKARKKAVFGDEKVHFDIKASFFEGTPVGNLTLSYHFGETQGTVVLNDKGEGSVDLIPDASCSFVCYHPRVSSLFVSPLNTEEGEIVGADNIRVFGPRVTLTASTKLQSERSATVVVQAHQIDISAINAGTELFGGEAKGAPARSLPVTAEVEEITYRKIETGQVYDFINKRTVKQYDYREERKPFTTITGLTDSKGRYEHALSIDPEKSYHIVFKTRDSEGREAVASEYIYSGQFAGSSGLTDFYSLHLTPEDKASFKLGEKVRIDFEENGHALSSPGGHFLFYRAQRGLRDFVVQKSPAYEFEFTQKEIPNIVVEGVWFDGRIYHVTKGWAGSNISVRYDPHDKGLKLEIAADKSSYTPGEEVRLKIQVRNQQGEPQQATVNLNLVDEAFYKLSYEVANPLETLYRPVSGHIYFTHYSHQYLSPELASGAEGGGCFLEGTKILMADGTERNIQDIRAGDTVLTFKNEFSRELVKGKVAQTFRHIVGHYLIINDTLSVTPEHRIFVNGTWRQIGEAKVGDWLLDSQGNKVIIESIRERTGLIPVYNLMIESYHTYIANGIYVHNDKGGERQNFQDIALFKVVETNAQGEAEVTFTLPDNITSWRVTTQAITGSLNAGVATTKLPVSLPLFADVILGKEYLTSDQPVIKTRAFGEKLKAGDMINFSVSTTLSSGVSTSVGKAFEPEYITLPALKEGEQKVTISASTTAYSDRLTRAFHVTPSRLRQTVRKYYTLTPELKIAGATTTERTLLTFTDSGRGKVYADLVDLSFADTDRIDVRVAEFLSREARNHYFNEHIELPDKNLWLKYQAADGGISLLPYSSSDVRLSAQIAFAAADQFDKFALKQYFSSILNERRATKEDISAALLGLASLGEPVLLEIKSLAKAPELGAREKLYLSAAALALDDREFARSIYFDTLKKYAVESKPYLKISAGKNEELNTEATAFAALIGAALNTELYHADLLNYIKNQGAELSPLSLERALYAVRLLPYLNSKEAAFTTTMGGRQEQHQIPAGGFVQLELTSEELASLTLSNIVGESVVVSTYQEPFQYPVSEGTPAVGLRREFYVRNERSSSFKETDLIEVRLYPSFTTSALKGRYQITDYVPSGMKIVTEEYRPDSYGNRNACARWYPYEIDGQIVKYSIDKDWEQNRGPQCSGSNYISYYVRVVTPGTYTAEPATIEHFDAESIHNYTQAEKVVISK